MMPWKLDDKLICIHLLHEDDDIWDAEGHGAAMLSFRSQVKLIPEDGSKVTSDGKLGRRHPDSTKYIKYQQIKSFYWTRVHFSVYTAKKERRVPTIIKKSKLSIMCNCNYLRLKRGG